MGLMTTSGAGGMYPTSTRSRLYLESLLSFNFVCIEACVCVRACVLACVTEYDHCGVLGTVKEICSCTNI